MFFKEKIARLEKEIEKIKNDTSPRTVVDYNTGYMIPIDIAVPIKLMVYAPFQACPQEHCVFFKIGTEPKCDYMEIIDGKPRYFKTIPQTNVQVNEKGEVIKKKSTKK